MSTFVNFVTLSLMFSIMLAIILTVRLKDGLTNMQGMIIAMMMGMNVGLTTGVMLGALYQGNLYFSTILSIGIGSIVGLTCGASLGLLPTLEGFMSGLMGGMMGAMLGEMITLEQSGIMINILLTITVSSLLLFLIFPNNHSKGKIESKSWFFKPIFTFILLFSLFTFGNQLEKDLTLSKEAGESNRNHGNHGESNENVIQKITVDVHPASFTYSPSKIIVQKNQMVTLELVNHDSIEHDLEIKNLDFKMNSESEHQGHSHNNEEFHLHAAAKDSSEFTFIPLQDGIYKFYCTIPGHSENGMIGELEVK